MGRADAQWLARYTVRTIYGLLAIACAFIGDGSASGRDALSWGLMGAFIAMLATRRP